MNTKSYVLILGVLIYGLYGINHSLASPDKRSQRLRPRERPNTLMLSPVPISSIPTDIGSTGANYATPTFDLSSNERRSIIKNKTRMPSRNENKEWKYMFSLREMFLKKVFLFIGCWSPHFLFEVPWRRRHWREWPKCTICWWSPHPRYAYEPNEREPWREHSCKRIKVKISFKMTSASRCLSTMKNRWSALKRYFLWLIKATKGAGNGHCNGLFMITTKENNS